MFLSLWRRTFGNRWPTAELHSLEWRRIRKVSSPCRNIGVGWHRKSLSHIVAIHHHTNYTIYTVYNITYFLDVQDPNFLLVLTLSQFEVLQKGETLYVANKSLGSCIPQNTLMLFIIRQPTFWVNFMGRQYENLRCSTSCPSLHRCSSTCVLLIPNVSLWTWGLEAFIRQDCYQFEQSGSTYHTMMQCLISHLSTFANTSWVQGPWSTIWDGCVGMNCTLGMRHLSVAICHGAMTWFIYLIYLLYG